MVDPITYLEFHALLILPPIVVLGILAWLRDDAWWDRQSRIGLGIVLFLAFVYTTPWDGYMIAQGVWDYTEGTIVDRFWHIPPGEYLFFILQPILTALWLYQFIDTEEMALGLSWRTRLVGVGGGFAVSAVGGYLIITAASTYYLGWILAWAGPIFAIQWGFGWPYLLRTRKQLFVGVSVPTVYLWIADWLAINRWGIWFFSDTLLTGIAPFGLPIEEATFFLVTNLFVVQALILWMWLLDQLGRLEHSTEFVPRPAQFTSGD